MNVAIMKTKLILLIFTLWQTSYAFAQVCGTPEPILNSQTPRINNSNNNITSVCLNVFFHIIRDNSGSGGINENQLTLIIDDLNSQYNNLDIFFVNNGFDFIDNTNYQNIGDSTEASNLAQVNNFPDSINYYIVNSLWNTPGGFITGTAISIPSNNLVIRRDRVLTPTSQHEVGHCLNLYHTHETFEGVESIDGSNCASAGDLVCDTPADPNLSGLVDSSCVYTGGGGYTPLTNNIMSYSSSFCQDELTNGQRNRMLNTITNNSLLSQIISSSCSVPKLSSLDFLCYPNTKTLLINNIDNNTATWQTSSNLQITAFTSNSITIEPDNSFVSGVGWVKATLNTGLILREEFWVGKPSSNNLVIYSSGNFEISTQSWYQLTAHHNNFSYLEHGNLKYEWQIPYAQLRMTPPKNKVIAIFPSRTGTYPYKLRTKNDCGCSSWLTKLFQVSNHTDDDDLVISPARN
ncbi:M43 family zinc metalloprotease [Flavobacteriaceae bacterium]|nr:M43 family zinc metalloprotease [Flavobacteriaceae bacterium]